MHFRVHHKVVFDDKKITNDLKRIGIPRRCGHWYITVSERKEGKTSHRTPTPEVVKESLIELKKILEEKIATAQESIDWINKHIGE